MSVGITFERCQSFIDCQLQTKAQPPVATHALQHGPAVTICRQAGSGAFAVAGKLAEFLQARDQTAHCPWTVFDRDLVEKVLEMHNLPKKFAQFMSEERRSYIADMVEELLGLHPASYTLARNTMETILHLAQMGHVILVGHGANLITARMANVFHVRLVGTLKDRIKHVMEFCKCGEKEAAEFVKKEDRGRALYIKEHFNCDVEDPLSYHLVINTSRVSFEQAARDVADAALRHFESCAASHSQ